MIDFTIHEHLLEWSNGFAYRLQPFGDVHYGSPSFHKDAWKDFLAHCKKENSRSVYLGMGDYLDLMSTSERRAIRHAELHDSTIETLEDLYMRYVDKLYNEISFMKGKLIGLLEGNHTAEFSDGTTSTQRLCQMLKCKYMGWSSHFRLSFRKAKSMHTCCVDCYAHHGKGGAAKMIGASMNHVQGMMFNCDAQIYLMGHDHARLVGTRDRLYLTKGNGSLHQKEKKQVFVRTGSFLKGYQPEKASYVARGSMAPASLGVARLDLICKTKSRDGYQSDYVDIEVTV